ncbi:steroidogenic acute regulatory protein-like [Onthophagus taurus]|uniref:steroidogenic acute regulatory protein-like n=1 Tax=Onthophagus taurus TaxID=166361 RepID=UPI0039BE3FC8
MHPNEDLRTVLSSALQGSGTYSTAVIPPSSIDITNSINSSSVVCQDYVISESILGEHHSDGRMSSVRRFFCLFVTFDLLFTSLMWLICIMLNGDSIWVAINKEIYHYNIHNSLFDIVLAAMCRFTVLLLFYGLLHINHWIIIALSTAGTCAFLISKVFVYNFQDSSQPVFQVLLVLTSFVLSWVEVWFLDSRVIPQESQARQIIISSPDTERTPLLRRFIQGQHVVQPSEYTESVGNFHSVQGSPTGSLNRFGETPQRFPSMQLSYEQIEKYKQLGIKAYRDSTLFLNSKNWKKYKVSDDDVVYVQNVQGIGKIYKLACKVNVAASFLFEELYHNVDKMTEWNTTLLESHKVQIIDQHTDITYQISKSAAAGYISSRDFVTLRRWQQQSNCYVIASVGVELPIIPPNDKYIRGWNGAGCQIITGCTTGSCKLEWILNSDLKGKIPTIVLQKAFVNMMFEYINNLRSHLIQRIDSL